jgi:hypothetical protein
MNLLKIQVNKLDVNYDIKLKVSINTELFQILPMVNIG